MKVLGGFLVAGGILCIALRLVEYVWGDFIIGVVSTGEVIHSLSTQPFFAMGLLLTGVGIAILWRDRKVRQENAPARDR